MPEQLLSTDPKAGQLLSTDAGAGVVNRNTIATLSELAAGNAGARRSAGARMSAGEPGLAFPGDANAVTIQDLMDNPVDAMHRIGANVKKEASDPHTWLALAASYFAPKLLNVAAPIVAKAAAATVRGAGQLATPGMVKDLAEIGLGEGRVSAALRVASRVAETVKGEPGAAVATPEPLPASAPAAPAPQAAPVGRTAATPPTSESLPAGPTGPSQTAQTMPTQKALNEAALAARRAAYQASQQAAPAPAAAAAATPTKPMLLAAEAKEYMRLIKTGKTQREALTMIQGQRDLIQQLGLTTPTAAETTFPKGMRGKVPPR